MSTLYDALFVVSFGGPEGMEEVMPFLESVVRGRPVPRDRLLEVARHYQQFDGVSPLNAQNRALIKALKAEFEAHRISLPIYWGNRNWHPLLPHALRQMADDGVQRALAFYTSPYSSYSGCRQYRENIEEARRQAGSEAPVVEKLRVFFNHPGFIGPNAEKVQQALQQIPQDRRSAAILLFSAHSIPLAMARNCRYNDQLQEVCRLVAQELGHPHYRLVYQSRSGPPQQAWLEPDICAALTELRDEGRQDAVIAPIGFISDHMEVVFDLDTEALEHCRQIGLNMVRAATVGTHPQFVAMIRELVQERISPAQAKPRALGPLGLSPRQCSKDCCL
ncbi:MAG: ferrochelatase [Acidobacteriota bacterium]